MTFSRIPSSWALAGVVFFGLTALCSAQTPNTRKPGRLKEPLRVGMIAIVGNETVPDRILLRPVLLFPGQVLNPTDLRRSERALIRLGVFEKVSVSTMTEDLSIRSPYRDIRIEVVESRWTRLLKPAWDLLTFFWICQEDGLATALELAFVPDSIPLWMRLWMDYRLGAGVGMALHLLLSLEAK